MRVGGGGALDIRWCTNLRRLIYDCSYPFPPVSATYICSMESLNIAVQKIMEKEISVMLVFSNCKVAII